MLPPDFFNMADAVKAAKQTTFEYPSATSTVWVTIRPDVSNDAKDYKVQFYKGREQSARYKTANPLEVEQLQQNPNVVEL
ncbi:MAG: hypothetical protein ACKN9T_09425 [Candidatus Methylumidiphilus sp.]